MLLRVFFTVVGDKVVLVLGGYDKGKKDSKQRQQSEIALARKRLKDWELRERAKRRQADKAGKTTGRAMGIYPYSRVTVPLMPRNIKDALKVIKRRASAAGADQAALYDAADHHFKQVADQLAALRMSLGVPQRELARRAGIDQGDVSKILSGRIPNPGIRTVVRLANALGAEIRLVARPTSSGRVVSRKRSAAKRS